MQSLNLAIKPLRQKPFVVLTILQVEKHSAKVKTSAIAYSPSVSTYFSACNHTPLMIMQNYEV